MLRVKAQVITNAAGEQVRVFLDLETWLALKEELENIDDQRALDEALAAPAEERETIPLAQALVELERK
jgi:hypothetical protein